ncbi:Processing alpha glucosidase I [Savitreella phatthalungensis]
MLFSAVLGSLLGHATATTGTESAYLAAQTRNNASLFWGPYRPNLYMGIRPRLPADFLAGLMWSNVDRPELFRDLRHTCEQDDSMGSYGWREFDHRTGGLQIIEDLKMNVRLTTHFVKLPSTTDPRGVWALRVIGEPLDLANLDQTTAIFFYAGVDNEEGHMHLEKSALRGQTRMSGSSPGLGEFRLDVLLLNQVEPTDSHTYSVDPPVGSIWKAKEHLFHGMSGHMQDYLSRHPDQQPPSAEMFRLRNQTTSNVRLVFTQYIFDGPFAFDVVYSSGSSKDMPVLDEAAVTEAIEGRSEAFTSKFDSHVTFAPPFDSPNHRKFGATLLSSLLGGTGYFEGDALVDTTDSELYAEEDDDFWETASAQLANAKPEKCGPYELFTLTPSRPFFPRGFYWDEGFHLMPASLWDIDLVVDVVKSWFKLVDDDGWIAREQILGDEARSKVPREFQTQFPHYANPPTLFITLNNLLEQIDQVGLRNHSSSSSRRYIAKFQHCCDGETATESAKDVVANSIFLENEDSVHSLIEDLYPVLRRHFDWFRRTQKGEIKAYDRTAKAREAYRWRGRTLEHCLTSGLDDYPRARPPHIGELHVDLHSWMGLMTRMLRRMAEFINREDELVELSAIEKGIIENLDALYWSENDKSYCDQTIDEYEESISECHIGYVTLFPVLLGLLPADHPNLGYVLSSMRDEDQLWTPYGLRSLAKSDRYYRTGEDYWRGPIWININYLALSSLYKNYIAIDGPYRQQAQEIYRELRKNVVETVYQEWKRSGIFFEQYNPDDGRGQRTKAFTGWTSCIVNIMAERY